MFEEFEKYRATVEQELKFDRFSVQQMAQSLPGKKHFWVGELVRNKIKLKRKEDEKRTLIANTQKQIKPEIGMTKASLDKAIFNSPEIKKLDQEIEEYKLIIEYLDHVTKIYYQCGFDLKNFIETLKLEEVK